MIWNHSQSHQCRQHATTIIPVCEIMAKRDVYVGMKRKKSGSTCTWSGVTARIIRRSYTMRNRSQAKPFSPRLEKPQAAKRLPCTSKSDRLPEKASNSCSVLNERRSRSVTWFEFKGNMSSGNWKSDHFISYLPCLKCARRRKSDWFGAWLQHRGPPRWTFQHINNTMSSGKWDYAICESHLLSFLNCIQVNFSYIVL